MADAVLYDETGTPIALPTPPPDPPTVRAIPDPAINGSVQDRFREYVTWNLSPGKIAEVLKEADAGEPYRWTLLCEEMLEKDPKLRSVSETRKRAVKGLYWDCAPCELDDYATAEEQNKAVAIAKFCGRVLRSTNIMTMISNQLTAVTKPHAVTWIDWVDDDQGNWVPRFKKIPATHVRWAFVTDEIRIIDPTMPTGAGQGSPVPPYVTVRSIYNPEEDHPTRAGLGRTVAFYELFKSIAIKDWVSYNERHGMPMRILKLPDEVWKNEEQRQLYRAALHNLGTDASAVLSDQATIEFQNVSASNSETYERFIAACDKAIAQLYLGHELSSQSSPGSGQLGISAALEVLESVTRDDCQWLSMDIKRDVLRCIVGFNFGWEWTRLTPEFYFDFEPEIDLLVDAQVKSTLAKTFGSNLSFSKAQIRDEFGIEAPNEDDPEDELVPSGGGGDSGSGGVTVGIRGLPASTPETVTPAAASAMSAYAARRKRPMRRRGPARYKAARQRNVDALVARSKADAEEIVAGWSVRLAQLVKSYSGDAYGLRRLIINEYSKLGSADLERTIREARSLARLYGRNMQ